MSETPQPNEANRDEGICIFCKKRVGLRKRTRLLLKHPIWVSGNWLTCPGTGVFARPLAASSVRPGGA